MAEIVNSFENLANFCRNIDSMYFQNDSNAQGDGNKNNGGKNNEVVKKIKEAVDDTNNGGKDDSTS